MNKDVKFIAVLVWLTVIIVAAGIYAVAWRDNDRKYQVKARIAEREQCIKQFDTTQGIAANPVFSAVSPLLKGQVGQCVLKYPIYKSY